MTDTANLQRMGLNGVADSLTAMVETITPEIAEVYLAQNKDNRSLRPAGVRQLQTAILRGEWMLNGESIKFDNAGRLMDGQHRLAAIVAAGVPVQCLVVRGATPEAQDTVDLGTRRSLAAALKIRKEPNSATLAAAIGWLHKFQNAPSGRRSGTTIGNLYPTIIQGLELLERNPGLRDSLAPARRVYSDTSFPMGLGTALHYTLATIDREDAEVFFEYFATGAALSEDHPIFQLRKTVERLSQRRPKPGQVYYAAVALKAWNKFKEGTPVNALRWSPGGANPEPFPHIRDY